MVRDHSPRSLARNTAIPLYLAAATVVMSLGSSATGFHLVLTRWSNGDSPAEMAIIGFTEALSPIILGTALAVFYHLDPGCPANRPARPARQARRVKHDLRVRHPTWITIEVCSTCWLPIENELARTAE